MNVERPVPPTQSENRQDPRPKGWGPLTRYALFVVAALGALAVWSSISGERDEIRTVASIPTESRRELYGRILENLKFCKAQSNDALKRFCSAEAEFILAFPECDRECKEFTRWSQPSPVR